MTSDEGKMLGWLAANVSLTALDKMVDKLQVLLNSATSLAQLAVAVLTAIFIYRKIRGQKGNKKTHKRKVQ
jgi:hypothetical protein